jgi:DNA-binding transcriptional LysR family regulator
LNTNWAFGSCSGRPAQALVEGEAVALASLRGTAAGASGLLRLTASLAFGRQVVAPLAVEFMKANPEVKIDLLLTDSLVDIVADGIDLAVRIADLADSSLIAKRLADNPRLLVASPAYIEGFGTPTELARLQRHECLTVSGSSHWDFRSGDMSRRVKVLGRFTANSIDAIHEACRGGLGIANLSHWDVRQDLEEGALVKVSLADAHPEPLSIWAVYPSRRMVPAKVRLFIDALSDHLKSRG